MFILIFLILPKNNAASMCNRYQYHIWPLVISIYLYPEHSHHYQFVYSIISRIIISYQFCMFLILYIIICIYIYILYIIYKYLYLIHSWTTRIVILPFRSLRHVSGARPVPNPPDYEATAESPDVAWPGMTTCSSHQWWDMVWHGEPKKSIGAIWWYSNSIM